MSLSSLSEVFCSAWCVLLDIQADHPYYLFKWFSKFLCQCVNCSYHWRDIFFPCFGIFFSCNFSMSYSQPWGLTQVSRNSDASIQRAFLAVYNMETTNMINFYPVRYTKGRLCKSSGDSDAVFYITNINLSFLASELCFCWYWASGIVFWIRIPQKSCCSVLRDTAITSEWPRNTLCTWILFLVIQTIPLPESSCRSRRQLAQWAKLVPTLRYWSMLVIFI